MVILLDRRFVLVTLVIVLMLCFLVSVPTSARSIVLNSDGTFLINDPTEDLYVFGDLDKMRYNTAAYIDINYLLEEVIKHLIETRVVMNKSLVTPGHQAYNEFTGEAAIIIRDVLLHLARTEGIDLFTNMGDEGLPNLTDRVLALVPGIEARNDGLKLAAAEFAQVFLYEQLSAPHTARDRIASTKFYLDQAMEHDSTWIEAGILMAESLLFEGKALNAQHVLGKNIEIGEDGSLSLKHSSVSPFLRTIKTFCYEGYPLVNYEDAVLGSVSEADTIIEHRYTRDASDWYTAYARALNATGQPQEGATYAQMALDRNPDNCVAWHTLGDSLLAMGEFREARVAFWTVIVVVNENTLGKVTFENEYTYYQSAAYNWAVIAFYYEDNLEEAVELIRILDYCLPTIHHLRRDYVDPLRQELLDELHSRHYKSLHEEKLEDALYFVQLADELYSDDPYIIYQLWVVNQMLGNKEEASRYLETLLLDHPDSQPARDLMRFFSSHP